MTLREEIEKLRDSVGEVPWGIKVSRIGLHRRLTRILDAHPAVPPPDWSEVPEWAEWVAVDADGQVTHWEKEPIAMTGARAMWDVPAPRGGWGNAGYRDIPPGVDWRELKWRRPG